MAISKSVGVFLISAFGIQTKAPCNFTNLPYLIVVAHMLAPLLGIPLTFVLLPKARMNEKLDVAGVPYVLNERFLPSSCKGVSKNHLVTNCSGTSKSLAHSPLLCRPVRAARLETVDADEHEMRRRAS
jgi:hypothetical protein